MLKRKTNEEFLIELKDKNIAYTPLEKYINYNTKISFRCSVGHIFKSTPHDIFDGNGCPYCSGRKALKGFNDLCTTHPLVSESLENKEDGYNVTFGSHKVLNWICPNCNNVIKSSVNNVTTFGLSCSACSDGISYAEKFVASLLSQLNIDFKREKTFDWSNKKRFDFYIESKDMIIETHGIQHYKENIFSTRTLQEEQENDKYKKSLALENKIKSYIELDCRESNKEYIKSSILDSELSSIFDLSKIDWEKCDYCTIDNIGVQVAQLWNEGNSAKFISNKLNIGVGSVSKYLSKMNDLGLCNYNKQRSHIKSNIKYLGKKVKCIETGKVYDSIGSVANDGFIPQKVSLCCNKKAKTHGRKHWEFCEEVV